MLINNNCNCDLISCCALYEKFSTQWEDTVKLVEVGAGGVQPVGVAPPILTAHYIACKATVTSNTWL